MRTGRIVRNTAETEILVELDLDGSGAYSVETGIGFLDHMIEQFARRAVRASCLDRPHLPGQGRPPRRPASHD
jgi:imidazoleglycerol phosphate dehydratase HisB